VQPALSEEHHHELVDPPDLFTAFGAAGSSLLAEATAVPGWAEAQDNAQADACGGVDAEFLVGPASTEVLVAASNPANHQLPRVERVSGGNAGQPPAPGSAGSGDVTGSGSGPAGTSEACIEPEPEWSSGSSGGSSDESGTGGPSGGE
jgi:hypothetical protein